MDLLKQLSEYCKTALPFLGMIYAAIVIYYDAPKDRSVFIKQGISLVLYGPMGIHDGFWFACITLEAACNSRSYPERRSAPCPCVVSAYPQLNRPALERISGQMARFTRFQFVVGPVTTLLFVRG